MAKRLQLLFVVTLAIWMSMIAPTTTTYAQTTPTTPGLGQEVVRVLEGNWQTLPPGTQHWYRFEYAGDDLPIRISLDVNPAESASFQVWTADQFSQLATVANISPVALSAAAPDDPTHIIWAGPLSEPGVYYIVIQPSTTTNSAATNEASPTSQYLINIGGRGLAPAPDGGAIVAGDVNVNVRSGPSTAYSVVQTIAQGTELTVLGQDDSGAWLFVGLPDSTQGWIARFLTGFTGTATTVTTPAQPSLAPPSTSANAAAIIDGASNVNLRSGPSTAYPVLRTLAQSTQFTVLGQNSTGSWLAVRFSDGSEGWIARYLTDFADNAPLVTAPIVAEPQLAPPATMTADQVFVANALDVNLRTGPSTLYPVVRTVPSSTQLTVLGQDPTSEWLSVQLSNGTQGWMARFLTNFAGVAATLEVPPLVQPPLAPPPTISGAPTSGISGVNLFTGPSQFFNAIRMVPYGSELTIVGQDSSGTWLSVRLADGTEGWVLRSLINFVGTVPVVSTPTLTQPPLAPPSTVTVGPAVASLPFEAASLDNFPIEEALSTNWRVLSAGQTQWLTFDQPGNGEPIQIWMDVEPNNASGFRIYRAGDAEAIIAGANPDDFTDIGRGTLNPNEPADLFWRGDFDESGRFYIMVDSNATSDISYSIYGVTSSPDQGRERDN